jgi:hypothetical protein
MAKFDFRPLAPPEVRSCSLFWTEVLQFCNITAEEEQMARLLLANHGPRQIARYLGKTRSAVSKGLKTVFSQVKKLIEANPIWVETYDPHASSRDRASHRPQLAFVVNREGKGPRVLHTQEPDRYPVDEAK